MIDRSRRSATKRWIMCVAATMLFGAPAAHAATSADAAASVDVVFDLDLPLPAGVSLIVLPPFEQSVQEIGNGARTVTLDGDGAFPFEHELQATASAGGAAPSFSSAQSEHTLSYLFQNGGAATVSVAFEVDVILQATASIVGPPLPAELDPNGGAAANGTLAIDTAPIVGGQAGASTRVYEEIAFSTITGPAGFDPLVVDTTSFQADIPPGEALGVSLQILIATGAAADGVGDPPAANGLADSPVAIAVVLGACFALGIQFVKRGARKAAG